MSEGRVRTALDQMETWLADASWEPEPEPLAQWQLDFQEAMSRAERSQAWPELAARAHRLGELLEKRATDLAQQRDAIKAELDAQDRGNRALRGYRTSAL